MSETAETPGQEMARVPDLDALYRRLQPALLRHLTSAHAWQAEDIAADVGRGDGRPPPLRRR